MDIIAELKQKLVTACRILDREKIMDELGHFSVRLPDKDRVLMNGRISPGQTKEESLIILDLDGKKVEGELESPSEIPLHLAIYKKREDVMAVAHPHPPTTVMLSIIGVKLRAVDNLGATFLGSEVPIYEEYGLVDNFDMGHRIADALGSHNLIVLKGHGSIVTGKSIEECCVLAIWAEKSARLQYEAMLIGEPHWYPEKEMRKVQQQVSGGKAFERAWNYYRWKLTR